MLDLQIKIENLTDEERKALASIGQKIKKQEYNRRYRAKRKEQYAKMQENFFIRVALQAQEQQEEAELTQVENNEVA